VAEVNNLNSVLLEGFVVSDPELSYTEKGAAVCRFKLESHRSYKAEDEMAEEVSYFEMVAHLRLAETCAEYLKKGRGVRVVGRLKQDGEKVLIEAEHVEFKPNKTKDKK
jgi:single-strand DNA-binding protein